MLHRVHTGTVPKGRTVKARFLLASQRIEVEALIRSCSLNPMAFRWVVGDSKTTTGMQVTRLEYRSAHPPAFFQFDVYRRLPYAWYSWGDTAEREAHFTGSWPQQAMHVARWLAQLRRRTQHVAPATAPVVPLPPSSPAARFRR
jgi:hypothetical protein